LSLVRVTDLRPVEILRDHHRADADRQAVGAWVGLPAVSGVST